MLIVLYDDCFVNFYTVGMKSLLILIVLIFMVCFVLLLAFAVKVFDFVSVALIFKISCFYYVKFFSSSPGILCISVGIYF